MNGWVAIAYAYGDWQIISTAATKRDAAWALSLHLGTKLNLKRRVRERDRCFYYETGDNRHLVVPARAAESMGYITTTTTEVTK